MSALDGCELIGSLGCGSAIVEMAFSVAGLSPVLTDLPYLEAGPGRERLLSLNPLGQVPTLVLPDGSVLTESAAMVLHVADHAPAAGLAPAPDAPERPLFLNLLALLVGAIYPTFTYGDDPAQWTGTGDAAERLRERTDARCKMLWAHVERMVSPAPFVLGARLSALDLYVCAMTRWRPRQPWFAAHAPKLLGARAATERDPAVAAVSARNWPGGARRRPDAATKPLHKTRGALGMIRRDRRGSHAASRPGRCRAHLEQGAGSPQTSLLRLDVAAPLRHAIASAAAARSARTRRRKNPRRGG